MGGEVDAHRQAPAPIDKAVLLARVEPALSGLVHALTISGFTSYEAGQITLSTRSSITSMLKERARRS